MKCDRDMGTMTWPLSETSAQLLPVYDRIHGLQMTVRELQLDARHGAARAREIQDEQKRMAEAITEARRDARQAVAEIDRRINHAILWLALGAGGLILKLIGPKLGL